MPKAKSSGATEWATIAVEVSEILHDDLKRVDELSWTDDEQTAIGHYDYFTPADGWGKTHLRIDAARPAFLKLVREAGLPLADACQRFDDLLAVHQDIQRAAGKLIVPHFCVGQALLKSLLHGCRDDEHTRRVLAASANRPILDRLVERFYAVLNAYMGMVQNANALTTNMKKKPGRKNDPLIPKIKETVRREREKGTLWDDIPAVVKAKHGGKSLSVATLKRDYAPKKTTKSKSK